MDPFDLWNWSDFSKTQSSFIHAVTTDSRNITKENTLFVALPGKHVDGHLFIQEAAKNGAAYALVKDSYSPPTNLSGIELIPVKDPLKSLQSLAKAYRSTLEATFIGITGSYGKTMTKDLLSKILEQKAPTAFSPGSFNSQIGVPLSIFQVENKHRYAVIEMGISNFGEMDILTNIVQPDHGILTNTLYPHFSSFKSEEDVLLEKGKLLRAIPENNWTLGPSPARLSTEFWDTVSDGLPQAKFTGKPSNESMPYEVYYPNGEHFQGALHSGFDYALDLINICSKAAFLLGASAEEISSALKDYQPEPMRTDIWRAPNGATIINDDYCATPHSVRDSFKQFFHSLPERSKKSLIFGGLRGSSTDKDYLPISNIISKEKLHRLILVGDEEFSPLIKEVARHSPDTKLQFATNAKEALKALSKEAIKDETILIKNPKKEPWKPLAASFSQVLSDNVLTVNLAALHENLNHMRNKLAKGTRLMVMLKAFGYGTDSLILAHYLSSCGVDIVGVAYVNEGIELKEAGINQDIFVINCTSTEAEKIVGNSFEVAVSQRDVVESLEAEAERQNRKTKIHLHVDTGMSRFGCRPEEALELAQKILSCKHLILEGLMTHFAVSDVPTEDAFTEKQADQFRKVEQELSSQGIHPKWKHVANSAAVMRFDWKDFNMVRVGLGMFGLHSSERIRLESGLRPAVTLSSKLVGINTCKRGDTISYGRTFEVDRDEARIGMVSLGYFDGLHQKYSGKGHVLIRGQKAPLVGTICMDFMMVDVTEIPEAKVGDKVLIFGEDDYGNLLPAEKMVEPSQSSVYEVLTCLGPRIQRLFAYEERR